MKIRMLSFKTLLVIALISLATSHEVSAFANSPWVMVDDFEQNKLVGWHIVDAQNDTQPFVADPQVTEVQQQLNNRYLLKKPAAEGVVGNRKAMTFKALPLTVEVGEVYTFYTRISVEHFPNNHAFGISNLGPESIVKEGYNAFEPTLRVTDKAESNGFKNTGALMVKIDSDDKYRQYSEVQNLDEERAAFPLSPKLWYQIWYVVNNTKIDQGGQTYDVYLQGGEFTKQTLVYKNAKFRMKREQPLIYFFANTNTGSVKKPYGNGGLLYDDIYMSRGVVLTNPTTGAN